MSEWACDRIEELETELEAAKAACDDLNVQVRFWRQCAEQALEKWNTLEDEHELLVDTLRALVAKEAVQGVVFEGRAPKDTNNFAIGCGLDEPVKLRIVDCPSSECKIRGVCTGHLNCPRRSNT